MGVPSFFFWLVRRFEKLMLHETYPYKHCNEKLGYLFLDFNSAIHPAVKADPNMKLEDMYQAAINYLEAIVNFSNPTKGIYIAIDGVAPRAKMEQQRGRRYKSIKEAAAVNAIKRRHREPVVEHDIDFNMISPGTEFMRILSEKICEYIAERKKTDWKDLAIHFSDATVPGEGEHKIMDFIRAHKDGSLGNVAIYGLDSDLIFLSLMNCPQHTVLVREVIEFGNKFNKTRDPIGRYIYMSIDDLKNAMVRILSPLVTLTDLEGIDIFNHYEFKEPARKKIRHYRGTDSDKQRLVMDYVFICFMLGNDFIQNLPSLIIREDGLDCVVFAYKVVSWQRGGYLVHPDGVSINTNFFKSMLQLLSEIEDDYLIYSGEQRQIRIAKFLKRMNYIDPLKRELQEHENVEHRAKDIIEAGTPGWQRRYYSYHFNIDFRHPREFEKKILPICQSYLEGMKWSLLYYQGVHNNWDWKYDYHAPPSVTHLLEALDHVDFNNIVFPDTKPVQPFVQLMSIMPPQSHKLLPPELGRLMTRGDSAIHQFYPLKIDFNIIGKKFLWECKPLLPEINVEKLKELVERIFRQRHIFREDLVKRNSHGVTKVF